MTELDDDQIRRLIHRIDPLLSTAAADDATITRLVDTAMSTDTSTPAPIRTRRSRLIAGGVGVLAAAAAAAIVIPLALGTQSTTVLGQPTAGGPAASCAVITPESIAASSLAFRGRVVSLQNNTVTLQVIDRFAGDVGDTVQVTQGRGAGVDGEPITFTSDATYLIATNGTTVSTCGASGIETPELTALFAAAFPGR